MERIGALIQRMLEQYNSNADRNSLILTAQMLLNELQENNNGSSVGGKKVTVILPSIKKVEISEQVIKQQEDNFEGPRSYGYRFCGSLCKRFLNRRYKQQLQGASLQIHHKGP